MKRSTVHGAKVGIIGGSIAGCAAAVALGRLGCDVHVFERSSGALRDRGSGIVIPLQLRDALIHARYLPADYANCEMAGRRWIVADGSSSGRQVWHQPGAGAANNWGVLWRALRAAVPDERYHDGATVTGFTADAGGATVRFSDGTEHAFDVLVGADGYRSLIRAQLWTQSRPVFAGYILWRGNYPEARLDERSRAAIARGDEERSWCTVCFDGGHGVLYMIPNFDDRTDPGHRRVNWAVYAPTPPGLDVSEPTSIPPGAVSPELYRHFDALLSAAFPPEHQALLRASPLAEISIQPIYDQVVDSYVAGRVLLIGDAGTVSRPHTGSGATKALQDALCLEQLGQNQLDWESLLAAYDAERTAAGVALVELGRRIGRDQVEHTPPWAAMTPAEFDTWTRGTLSGQQLYFYGNVAGADAD